MNDQQHEAERDRLALRAENAEADYAGARRHVKRLEAERDREREARIAFEKEALRYRRELTEVEAERDRLQGLVGQARNEATEAAAATIDGLAHEVRDLRAVVWGAAVLIREHRVTQAATLLEDSIPEGYVPVGAPNQPGGTHAQDPDARRDDAGALRRDDGNR